jgi:hypothetical protein
MARLIYSAITSLDGYVADAEGTFEWAAPDEEVHAFVCAPVRDGAQRSEGAGSAGPHMQGVARFGDGGRHR